MNPIEVEDLVVRYGQRTVLEGITFRVREGQVYALLGRNGAGKSSLFRCLLGWQRPQGGVVRLFGEEAWTCRARAMARIGVVPEHPDLPPRQTLGELGDFCAGLYAHFDLVGYGSRLDRAGISLKQRAGSLSRGQKAQAALALALAPQPELLVLDDPTLGLDAVSRRAFFESLVVDLADRGVSVLLTTHDLAGAEGIADRVGILHKGGLLCDEALETLKGRLRRIRWSESAPDLGGIEVLRSSANAFGGEALVGNWPEGRPAAGLRIEALSLEEAFIALTDEGLEVRV